MMTCIKCKKRPAVVFLQRQDSAAASEENKPTHGYCLTCAQEMGIQPVVDMMNKFGVSGEDLPVIEDQFAEMVKDGKIGDMMESAMENMSELQLEQEENGDEDPSGGPALFPFMFGNKKKEKKDGGKQKESKRKFLDSYCEDLTKKARDGKLDRVIGRDREVYRTIQILSRRQKNNPCLVGEAGVGKTAIAEGIAQRIVAGDVPSRLRDKEIYLLDLTSLVAGTQFRGQFESRVKGLINEVKEAGNVILFIDEVHNITGAGDSEGAMNAGNILKPALSRGEIQVIGATTFTEYRKFIEKDQALERRFQPVKIEEPSIADTILVLVGVKEYYEAHHYVKISDALVGQLVKLSERYITDRFLPDKAIDLLDEACASCSLRHSEITDWREFEKELAALREELSGLEQTTEPDYEKIAQIKSEIARISPKAEELEKVVDKIEVTMDDVAKVIELWTGIPSVKIAESEFNKLADLEASLKEKIIGQDEAVELVAKAVKRARADISGRRRPASFIFVGPTGVGKTELVKQLAFELFDSVDPLIRLDMSEFMEKHAVSRLVGSPPGYVGYDEAGQLTEKVRRKPYSVVLFDEIEKAHPDVMNILLQILDEGKINDAQGRTVSFENTVICMTSNAGSSERIGETGFDKSKEVMSRNKSMKALKDFLRPEFLSRVDEVVVFDSLKEDSLEKIAALMLSEYKEPLETKGITIEWDDKALAALCKEAEGGQFGARDLRRAIRKEVEDVIAEGIVQKGKLSSVVISAKKDKVTVTLS